MLFNLDSPSTRSDIFIPFYWVGSVAGFIGAWRRNSAWIVVLYPVVHYYEHNSTLEIVWMIYMVDIDGTICYTEGNNYEDSSIQYKNVLITLISYMKKATKYIIGQPEEQSQAQTGKVLQRHNYSVGELSLLPLN